MLKKLLVVLAVLACIVKNKQVAIFLHQLHDSNPVLYSEVLSLIDYYLGKPPR